MRILGIVALIVAGISLVLGIISRIILQPLPILPGGGVEAEVFLNFTNTCLLAAIALAVLGKK
ncbi:MAG: hypothetical protein DRP69_05745 [Candidatus Duberdicusella sinuisediminis]|nr:MAG: hypothetical protein DRP69_05745 [Candidatus Omnitrophota bacterium]